jgi:hypothetical protein
MNEPLRSELYDHARTDLMAGTRFYEAPWHIEEIMGKCGLGARDKLEASDLV